MENGTGAGGNLLRLTGIMGNCVGVAWALQILASHSDGASFGRLLWVVAAAAIAGGGTGLIVAAGSLQAQPTRA